MPYNGCDAAPRSASPSLVVCFFPATATRNIGRSKGTKFSKQQSGERSGGGLRAWNGHPERHSGIFEGYPDIYLKLSPIGARDFANRTMAERRAGKYLVDVFTGGTTSPTLVLVPANAVDPIRPALILPEVSDESLWFKKKIEACRRFAHSCA